MTYADNGKKRTAREIQREIELKREYNRFVDRYNAKRRLEGRFKDPDNEAEAYDAWVEASNMNKARRFVYSNSRPRPRIAYSNPKEDTDERIAKLEKRVAVLEKIVGVLDDAYTRSIEVIAELHPEVRVSKICVETGDGRAWVQKVPGIVRDNCTTVTTSYPEGTTFTPPENGEWMCEAPTEKKVVKRKRRAYEVALETAGRKE